MYCFRMKGRKSEALRDDINLLANMDLIKMKSKAQKVVAI